MSGSVSVGFIRASSALLSRLHIVAPKHVMIANVKLPIRHYRIDPRLLHRSEENTSQTQSPFGTFFASFFFNDTATTEIYTLSLHDALPISHRSTKACYDRECKAAHSPLPDRPTPSPWPGCVPVDAEIGRASCRERV